MDRRKKSREEWERELSEDQHTIVPADGLSVGHIMARRSTSRAPIRGFFNLIGHLVAVVLLGIGFEILHSNSSSKAAVGTTCLILGCCVGIVAFLGNRRRS